MAINLNQNLAGLLLAVSRAVKTFQKQTARRFHLTRAEFQILLFLKEKGPRTVPKIARVLGFSRQNVQVTVNALLTKGLLLSVTNPDHKTSSLFPLTETGLTTVQAIEDLNREGLDKLFNPLDLGEKTQIKRSLQRIL